MSEEHWKRIKRLTMQSNRRGMKENDIILGKFSLNHIYDLDDLELIEYEGLLLENDQDLYLWLSGGKVAPDQFKNIIRKIITTLKKN